MKKLENYCSIIFLFLLATTQVKAQSVDVVIRENGTERKESIDLPKSMTYPLDSLLNDWKAKNYIDLGKDCSTAEVNPLFSDSVYIDRLSRIPAVMEMPYNDIVRKFIDMYAGRLRNQVSFMLSACNFYMPIFEEALDAYGLPLELKYLPIIESALNPSAVSRAGASGLWQFMIGTGKIYGLESNSLIDERRDPIKATWAAARYLKEMYDIYGDWNLVIAAYNCGPGTINKAIRRAGGETDYWKIYNLLPKETRGYVPAFIAANYVMTYYCDHNICPMETNIPASTDTVQVTKNLHFEQLLLKYALHNDTFREVAESHFHSTPATNVHPDGITYYSTMFKNMSDTSVTGGEILGGKTGYTSEAGHCLASFAQIYDREYILVTAGAAADATGVPHILDAKTIYNRLGEAVAQK